MAAPATTARVAPTGIRLDDGYSTKIAFARDSNIQFWEKTVQPPSVDGGDAIDTTTMHNATYRTMAARSLITLGESKCTVAYDPDVYNAIIQLVNQEGAITVSFPDGSTLSFFGFLSKFEPGDLAEGEQPEADVTIIPTNWDPVNRVEAAPVLTSVAGT